MKPTLTVGIPFFNSAATLESSIRSVFAQSFADWELLLIDDGSTDGSVQIAHAIDDRRVHVISDGVNRGLVYRLNQMISLAQTPYFARMDADDLMHPERLSRQLAYLRDHPETDIVGSAAYVIDREGRPYGIRGDRPERLATASVRAGFLHPTVLAKTDWFRRNPYDPEYVRAEDVELWKRADATTVARRLLEPLLFYRESLEFQAAKYRVSCRTLRKIAWDQSAGASMITALAAICGKEGLHLIFDRLGVAPALIRRRNRACEEAELRSANEILQQIALVRLPMKQTAGVLVAG